MGLRNQLLLDLYKDKASVFTMQGIAMAYGQGLERNTIKNRMISYVKKGEIINPRKGIYAKPGYDEKELACLLYTPSYISLEYVLQRAGIIFQYSDEITSVGNLSRSVEIDGKVYRYRKIKGEILIDTAGVIREGNVNIATQERAFLDTLYLNSNYYFDNPISLDKQKVLSLLPIYNSKTLEQRVTKNSWIEMDTNRHKFFMLQLLKDIFSDALLSSVMAFKGGTATIVFLQSAAILDRSGLQSS